MEKIRTLNHKINTTLHNDKLFSRERVSITLLKLILYLLTGSFFVYYLSFPYSNFIFYTFVFYRFIYSRNIVFWVAFLFIIVNNPWGLFYYKPYNWYFNLTSTVGVTYLSAMGIAFLLRYYRIKPFLKNYRHDYLQKYYKPFIVYVIFLLVLSLIFGHNVVSVFKILTLLPILFVFLLAPVMFNQSQMLSFNKIIFAFSIIHFIGSIAEIVTSNGFFVLLTFGKPPTGVSSGEDLIRITGGITLHLYVIITGLFYLAKNQQVFKNWYLWLIVLLSVLFILSSATRGWMIALAVLFAFYFVYSLLSKGTSIVSIFSGIAIVILLWFIIPGAFKKNVQGAFNRLETVGALLEGDMTAEGSLKRLDVRGPRVMTRFSDSPVFGFGYSKVTSQYYDGHVGNHSLLLMGGVVGLALVWLTAIALVIFFLKKDMKFNGKGYFVFSFAIIAIMTIHSSSRVMISYYFPSDVALLLGLLFNNFNTSFNQLSRKI